MNINEALYYIQKMENYNKLPTYITVSDISESQVKIDGIWQNVLYAWGILQKDNHYIYFKTDNERGYLSFTKCFDDENSVCEYVVSSFKIKNDASFESTPLDMAVRYIEKKYGYSTKRAQKMVEQLSRHHDVFEEFQNYMHVGKFRKKDWTKVEVEGYTAEKLNAEYNLSPLGAYNYLVYLIEDPQNAISDLKKGLPKK
jgi:hypothetical protein